MISIGDAITLFLTGGVFALACTFFGALLRSGWMARKLATKKPKVTP